MPQQAVNYNSQEEQLGQWLYESSSFPVDDKQQQLTDDILRPHQSALLDTLHSVRKNIDHQLRDGLLAQSTDPPYDDSYINPKRYPIGFCGIIRDHAWNAILPELDSPHSMDMEALGHFVQEGGVFKRINGIQHQRFFQNGLQAGGLWIDLANDTMDPSKPPIQICDLPDSGFEDIRDLEILGEIMESYWGHTVYPNTLMPDAAPLFPLVTVSPNGCMRVTILNQSIIAANVLLDFELSERFLFESRFSHRRLPCTNKNFHHDLWQKHLERCRNIRAKGGIIPLIKGAEKIILEISSCH